MKNQPMLELSKKLDGLDYDQAFDSLYPYGVHKLDIEAVIPGTEERQPIHNSKVLYRTDGKELATCGEGFETVQHEELKELFREILTSDMLKLKYGGEFRNGSCMFAYAEIAGAVKEVVKDDTINGGLMFYAGFDGKLSIGGGYAVLRSVCSNTCSPAERAQAYKMGANVGAKVTRISKQKTFFTAKHTKNVRIKLETCATWVKNMMSTIEDSAQLYKQLANKRMTRNQQENYIFHVIVGKRKEDLKANDEISTKTENTVQHVIDLLENQKGLEYVPAIRGTAWQAYNAVTDYLTHSYGRSADSRFNALHFGTNTAVNSNALALAIQH